MASSIVPPGADPLFSQLSKFQLCLAFIFLMLLRIVIGFHFYKEGTAKLKSGTFSSKGFLSSAKGPLAPWFNRMLDDPDGMKKLCIKESENSNGTKSYSLDPELTLIIWDQGFADEAASYYDFGSQDLQSEIALRRDKLAKKITQAREAKDNSVDTSQLESRRAIDEENILRIRQQRARLNEILEAHTQQLIDWLSEHEVELISHFSSTDRLDGFARDGQNRHQVAIYVDSLRGQVDSIRTDRQSKLRDWTSEVTEIWDSYEAQVNALAVDKQAEQPKLLMHRHFDQKYSFSKWVDRVIPWFDTIVGVLLIIGLFSRIASLAAAMFLVSVILTQPPWIPGTVPTYFYFIELLALLVIFATCAGRLGGLDYFFSLRSKRTQPQIEEPS